MRPNVPVDLDVTSTSPLQYSLTRRRRAFQTCNCEQPRGFGTVTETGLLAYIDEVGYLIKRLMRGLLSAPPYCF